MPPIDRGAAPERTRLSWRRTSLAGTVVVILLLRLAIFKENRTAAVAITAVVALSWVVLLVAIQRRVRALARPVALRSTGVLTLTATTGVAFAMLGVLLILL